MRTLAEIHNNLAILIHLRWDLTDEMLKAPGPLRFHPTNEWNDEGVERIQKEHEEQAGFYFCIHAWNNRPRLALIHFLPDGDRKVEDISGFPEEMLIEAIQQSSESIQHAKDRIYVGGHFPINKPIEDVLRAGLLAVGMKQKRRHSREYSRY